MDTFLSGLAEDRMDACVVQVVLFSGVNSDLADRCQRERERESKIRDDEQERVLDNPRLQ